MTVANDSNRPGGTTNQASGDGSADGSNQNANQDQNDDDGDGNLPPDDKPIARDSYLKAVDEAKKAKARAREAEARLAQIEAEKDAAKRKKLEKDGEYQKLLEAERKEREKLAAQLAQATEREQARAKLTAFVSTIEHKIPKNYLGLVDLDEIAIDPDTGEVDGTSVAAYVDKFKTTYPEILVGANRRSMPNEAPPGGAKLTYEQWLTLPTEEMKRRRKEVMQQ